MADKCGAKTRAGGRCRQYPMPDKKRCKFHGGMSTGPKVPNTRNNARTHGIYSRFMTPEEVQTSESLQLGTVDAEIRLMRIQLQRALSLQALHQGTPELDEVTEHDLIGDEGSREDRKSKVRDYLAIIDKLTSRIESLEKTRLLLRIELGLDPEDMDAHRLTPGTPDEAPPQNPIR